jgi:hypothetical protein
MSSTMEGAACGVSKLLSSLPVDKQADCERLPLVLSARGKVLSWVLSCAMCSCSAVGPSACQAAVLEVLHPGKAPYRGYESCTAVQ